MPEDLPLLLQLDDWQHPQMFEDELPSQSPSFQMLAEVIATGDARRYRPHAGNVHWKNWTFSGSM